jgi:hypothetical protein
MRIFVAALLAFVAFSAPALGGDIKSALKEFGLIGTWSSDCSKEISPSGASRIVFAAPLEGSATATTQDNRDEVSITIAYEIVESEIVDSDKIRIALHPVKVTRSDGKAASRHDYDNVHLVFQKAGERIEAIRIQWEGLPEIELTKSLHKCLN